MDMFLLLENTIQNLIYVNPIEWEAFSSGFEIRSFKKQDWLSHSGAPVDEIFFVNKGIVRVVARDNNGEEHTIHFAAEGQFIADYASYLRNQKAQFSIQALSDVEVVVLSRGIVDWGYENLINGQKLGRLIAEYYFSFHDDHIKSLYLLTPKERYEQIENLFPGIISRVPQHMIASFLGMTSVHLSRLKQKKS